jgi:hypothetical protein
MKKEQIKFEQYPTRTGNRTFLKAKQSGFAFKGGEKKYIERCERKDEVIADIGKRPKPIDVILAFACIGIALVFAFIEATNVQATIVGAMNINETAAIIIGFAFAASGLVCGEMLSSSWKQDKFTGRKTPTPKFYLALAFAAVYVVGQYYLASRAGVGIEEEMQENVTTMKWFVLGIALAELLFGMTFLATALKIFTLFVANIRIRLAMRIMNRKSRATEEAWQRYQFENDSETSEPETPAIADARRFYNTGGFNNKENHYNTPN